jgi:LPXTG-motif cell wall-anchored protein
MRPAALGLAYTLAAALLLPAPPLAADPPPAKTETSTAPAGAPPPQPATQTTATAPQPAPPPQPPAPVAPPAPAPAAAPAKARSAKAAKPRKAPKAHAAAPGSVTIKDFSYGPAAVTVSAGDSVTWVNQGPTKHSATAKDGSFDTGLLAKGGSASHTFTKAGTFSYVCSIHPFMHGTVKVVAAAAKQTPSSGGSTSSSSTPSSSSSASTSSSSGGAAASSKPSLPRTGGDAGPLALLGLLFVGLGVIGRRRSPAA